MKEKSFLRGNKIRCLALLLLFLGMFSACEGMISATSTEAQTEHTSATFAMDTFITQAAYGVNATKAMQEFNLKVSEHEKALSLFIPESDIARINAAAGKEWVVVSDYTFQLLQQGFLLSEKGERAFAFTIAPISLAWGINGDTPRVLAQSEIDSLLPLVDDSLVELKDGAVFLPKEGMGIDLGGFAKGAACSIAEKIYEKYGIESAFLSIGGNVYVRGTKPNGEKFRVGFRDPQGDETASVASFLLQDNVIAVSGGYERYFEKDGKRYIHIMDPKTGWPAQSDIVSVGAINPDGAVAEFYSTTLFVWGKEKTIKYMQAGGQAIMLCKDNVLYVSKSLEEGFKLYDDNNVGYRVEFI